MRSLTVNKKNVNLSIDFTTDLFLVRCTFREAIICKKKKKKRKGKTKERQEKEHWGHCYKTRHTKRQFICKGSFLVNMEEKVTDYIIFRQYGMDR